MPYYDYSPQYSVYPTDPRAYTGGDAGTLEGYAASLLQTGAVGGAAGTAVGTAILPGIGTAVGAIVGWIVGLVGGGVKYSIEQERAAKAKRQAIHEKAVAAARAMAGKIDTGEIRVDLLSREVQPSALGSNVQTVSGLAAAMIRWLADQPAWVDPLSYLKNPVIRAAVQAATSEEGVYFGEGAVVSAVKAQWGGEDLYADLIATVVANSKLGDQRVPLPTREQVKRAHAWRAATWEAWARDVQAYDATMAEHRRLLARRDSPALYMGLLPASPPGNSDDQANRAHVNARLAAVGLPRLSPEQLKAAVALPWIKAMEKIFGPQTLVARRPVAAAPMHLAGGTRAASRGPSVGKIVAVGGLGVLAWLLFL